MIAAYGTIDVAQHRCFNELVSSFNGKPIPLHNTENVAAALRLVECIIHPIMDHLWEDTNAPSDVNIVSIK